MKQRILIALLALALVPGTAAAVGVGLGVYGGVSLPVLQDNAGNGTQFGVRVPVSLIPLLSAEGYYASSALGDVDETFGGQTYTRSGPDVKTYGLNAILHLGTLYPFVGIGSTTIEQSGSDDITDTNIGFGLGLGFNVAPKFSIHVRGELNSVITGDTSRKFGNLTAGVNYALFNK